MGKFNVQIKSSFCSKLIEFCDINNLCLIVKSVHFCPYFNDTLGTQSLPSDNVFKIVYYVQLISP